MPRRFYSAFTQTDLATTCQIQGIDRIVLTGQHTNACARHTSYDAFTRGIELAVVADATCVVGCGVERDLDLGGAASQPLSGFVRGQSLNS